MKRTNIVLASVSEDEEYCAGLRSHFKAHERVVDIWTPNSIIHGNRDDCINEAITKADIIILLLSKNSIDSDEFNKCFFNPTLKYHNSGKKIVYSLLATTCFIEGTDYAKITSLLEEPLHSRMWKDDKDEPYAKVVKTLMETLGTSSWPISNNTEQVDDSLHIIEQMYNALKVFEGFKSIYPRTIANLYPFRLKSSHYNSYCLETDNPKIYEVLQSIEVKEGDIEIKDDSLIEFKDKVSQIFEILNDALIKCIAYDGKRTSINLRMFDPNCNCLYCQYHRFQITSLFGCFTSKSLVAFQDSSEALGYAYYSQKMGRSLDSWSIYDKYLLIPEQNYTIRFLASYNTQKLYNYIVSYCEKEEREVILPKILAIDLHKELCGADMPIALRDELIRIKESSHLYYAQERIDDIHASLLRFYQLYQRGGNGYMGVSAMSLYEEMMILFQFYVANHIHIDDSNTFSKIIEKGVDGILISFSTSPRYKD